MKPIRNVKCIVPFTDLSIHHQGDCYTCNPEWTKIGSIVRLTAETSLMDIWNGAKIQQIRQAVLDDRLEEVCNFEYCPHAAKVGYPNLDIMMDNFKDPNFNRRIDYIRAGQTVVDVPPYNLVAANFGSCNLNCIMCTSNHRYIQNDIQLNEKLYTQIIPEMVPGISRLHLGANGEIFSTPW